MSAGRAEGVFIDLGEIQREVILDVVGSQGGGFLPLYECCKQDGFWGVLYGQLVCGILPQKVKLEGLCA